MSKQLLNKIADMIAGHQPTKHDHMSAMGKKSKINPDSHEVNSKEIGPSEPDGDEGPSHCPGCGMKLS